MERGREGRERRSGEVREGEERRGAESRGERGEETRQLSHSLGHCPSACQEQGEGGWLPVSEWCSTLEPLMLPSRVYITGKLELRARAETAIQASWYVAVALTTTSLLLD